MAIRRIALGVYEYTEVETCTCRPADKVDSSLTAVTTFGLVGSISCDTVPFEYYQRLRVIRDFVRANIDKPITLQEAADAAGLSKSHCSRKFRELSGLRFRDWLMIERIEHSKSLLLTKDQTITTVAFASGFGSISSFKRAFKKIEGITPRAFRRDTRRRILGQGAGDRGVGQRNRNRPGEIG